MIGRRIFVVEILIALTVILLGCIWIGSETPTPIVPATVTSPPQTPTDADPIYSLGPGGGGAFDVFAFSPEYVFVGTDVGGIFRSADHGQSWKSVNDGLYDYMVNDIAVDPVNLHTLYIATPGGVYRSNNDGGEWQLLENGFPQKQSNSYSAEIGTVAIDPSNSQIIYAGMADIREQLALGNGDIYKSTNSGGVWNKINIGNSNAAIHKIIVDPLDSEYVFAATSTGFFRSADGGQTWAQVDDLQSRGLAVGIDTVESKTILYRTVWNTGVYKSADKGQNWEKLNTPYCPKNCQYHRIAIDPSDIRAQTVYIGDYGDWNQDQGIFVTTNGGDSWAQINNISEPGWGTSSVITRVRSLGLNPYDPLELYFGHSMGIFRKYSNDPWKQVFTIQSNVSDETTTNWAGKWVGRGDINNTQVNTKPMFNPKNQDEYYLGYSDLYIWKTIDDGKSWESIQTPGNNDVRALTADPNDEDFLTWFAGTSAQQCCDGELYKTTDGGQQWLQSYGLPNDRIWEIAITPGSSNVVYTATFRHGLYWSTDAGESFSARNGGAENSLPEGSIYDIALDPQNPNILYVPIDSKEGGIFKTTNSGETWAEAGNFSNCYTIAVSPLNSQEIFAGCNLMLYKSEDGGNSWQTLFQGWEHPLHPGEKWTGAYIRDIALHPNDPRTLCFVIKDDPYHDQSSGGGLYCTIDGGQVWKELAKELGMLLRGVSVAFHPLPDPTTHQHDLFYMTGGNGAYKISADIFYDLFQETDSDS